MLDPQLTLIFIFALLTLLLIFAIFAIIMVLLSPSDEETKKEAMRSITKTADSAADVAIRIIDEDE